MVVDSYVHLGLPRFQSIEDELAVMRRYSIDKAIVCPFESCPDLEMVHRAFTANPERFPGAGLPVGADRTEMTAGLNAQFEAGFGGIRLSGGDVAGRPWLLDVIGENHGFALVVVGRVF